MKQARFPGFAREPTIGPQDCIFQHLPEPDACSEGGIKKYPKYPIFMLTASDLWMPVPLDCLFQHLLKHDACPEGGSKNNQ